MPHWPAGSVRQPEHGMLLSASFDGYSGQVVGWTTLAQADVISDRRKARLDCRQKARAMSYVPNSKVEELDQGVHD